MDNNSNFERAKKLTEDWPSWKREYQLTKNSEGTHESKVVERHVMSSDEQTKHPVFQIAKR